MGKITKIEFCKKNNERANIYVDDEFVCEVFFELIFSKRLSVGLNVDSDTILELKVEDEKKNAFLMLINSISKKRLTEKQAREKLKKKEFLEDAINEAIEKAKGYGYINDENFAKDYIEIYGKKRGCRGLKHELILLGVKKNIINDLLESHDESEYINKVLDKYLKNKNILTVVEKIKAYKYLLSKGFSSDTIKNVIEEKTSVNSFEDIEFDE